MAKRKNDADKGTLKIVFNLWLLVMIFGAILLLLTNSQTISEVVIVPFDRGKPTLTENQYSDVVQLTIEGSGQAGGSDYSDAFYLYAQADGTPYLPPWLEHFDLEIDGQRAIHTLDLLHNPPPYNPDHIYHVNYDVGDKPRKIAFRISDSVVNDNTGEFRITIQSGD